jgi:ribosome-binding factor A
MVTRRRERLAAQIVRELSDILQMEMRDPRLGFASITDAEVSKDLRHAQVYVSILGTPEQQRETMELLHHATGFLRTKLAERLQIRHVPELQFKHDRGIERGTRILQLLRQIEAERAANPPRLDEPEAAAEAHAAAAAEGSDSSTQEQRCT